MRQTEKFSFRYHVVKIFFLLLSVVLIWRLVDLTIINRSFLARQGDARSLRITQIPAYRGMIKDRTGKVLAVSTPVFSIWIDPSHFDINNKEIKKVIKKLKIRSNDFKNKLSKSQKLEFMYLKRGVPPHVAEELQQLRIPSLYFQREFRRYYPEGEVISHIVGFTDIDDNGQEGIELSFDDWLRGRSGKKKVQKNRLNQIIQELGVIKEPQNGQDLTLSIDFRLQLLAHQELKAAIKKYGVKSGSIVVMDAIGGEVLAMANYPTYNPNTKVQKNNGQYRNRAMTDLFEPGSVMKVFPIVAALESGKYNTSTIIDTHPGWMVVNNHTIKDFRNYGELTVADVLKKSSNIGVAKIVFSMPADNYTGLLRRVGFGRDTGSDFPGEVPGYITNVSNRNEHTLATLAFGYSLAVTPIQLARSYSVFLGDGKLRPISFFKQTQVPDMQQVITEKVSKTMLNLLEKVVEDGGTGKKAKIAKYKVAGKTGTTKLLGKNGYDKDRHLGTFVGIAPASKPRIIIAVVLQDPPKGELYYGGAIAAPVFANVMQETLRILEIAPDKA